MPIRHLTVADKDQILELDQIIFNSIDLHGGWSSNDFNHFFNEEWCYAFYDEQQPEKILGYIFVRQEGDHIYISNLGVDPRVKKRGIGTELMKTILLQEQELSKKRTRPFSVQLDVDINNKPAIRFYMKFGFQMVSRGDHGFKMSISQLPKQFKNKDTSLSKKALIIRNAEGFSYSELEVALDGLTFSEQAPETFNELIHLIHSKATLHWPQLEKALALFKQQQVRDYVYQTVKEKTGNYIIYHLNGIDEQGVVNENHFRYLTNKLAEIPANTEFDVFYLGGGHGSPFVGSSNLNKQQLQSISDILTNKSIRCSVMVFGSCFSTAYLGLFQPLLKAAGVTLSNSLECGGDNHFKSVIAWVTGQQTEFYSNENIRNSIFIAPEARVAFRRILSDADLSDDYNHLLEAYKQTAYRGLGLSEDEFIEEIADEMFNNDVDNIFVSMCMNVLNKERLQNALSTCPKLKKYIQAIADKKGEDFIFNALLDCLTPLPTTLAVGTAKSLTMFNYSNATTRPQYVTEDFQKNYRAVLSKVHSSKQFSDIQEVSQEFGDVSVKKQFNNLFAQATKSQKQREEDLHHREQKQRQQQKQEQNQQVFNAQLDLLLDKISEFEQRPGTEDARKAAYKLYTQLNTAAAIYFSQPPTVDAYKTFKSDCNAFIKEAREQLEMHRGWSEFLRNLALAVGTLGFGLLIKGFINVTNNRAFFFCSETDSSKRLGLISDTVNSMAPNDCSATASYA